MQKQGELLKNQSFVRWVKQPDEHSDRYWQKWLDANPERREEFFKAREIVLGIQAKRRMLSTSDQELLLANILKTDKSSPTIQAAESSFVRLWRGIPRGTKVAACVVLLIGFLFGLKDLWEVEEVKTQEIELALTIKETKAGQKSRLTLPDGTSVWLNAGSRLEYISGFADSVRQVFLKGEAYFDVMKDPLRPFSVITGDLTTTALGTAFNINTYHHEPLDIALLEGKVKVENERTDEKILLTPGKRLQYFSTEGETLVNEFDEMEVVSWKDGVLYFKEAPYRVVVEELERWYGVTIQTKGNPRYGWQLSGRHKNESLKTVLDRMSYVETFDYDIKGKSVKIQF